MNELGGEPKKIRQNKTEILLEKTLINSPKHPFTSLFGKIKQIGEDAYSYSFNFGFWTTALGQGILTRGYRLGKVDEQTYQSIMEAFKPLQHMTNMEISYAIIGTSIVAADLSEGFLEAANKPKAAKVIKKALPVVGAITATGLQLFLESRKVVNWDTLDSSDAIYGIAVIAPAYFAARHFLSKNLHLKEKGVALFGKFNKKVESPSEIILPEDLAVIESKTITED